MYLPPISFWLQVTSIILPPSEIENFLKKWQGGGTKLGLHFDEEVYSTYPEEERKAYAERERKRLEDIIEIPITTVSMHRPAKTTLDANWQFDSMINSYSDTFFRAFKYLSDSRRRWREDVWEIIASGKYSRIHILTHPFWYHDQEENLHDTLAAYINGACMERYSSLLENFTDLSSVIERLEVNC